MNEKEAWIEFARGLQLLCHRLANDLDQKTESVASKPFPSESKLEKALGHTPPGTIESFDPSKIKWTSRTGEKGAYEFATGKGDAQNGEYSKLVNLLKSAGGSMTKNGLWYWLFPDGEAVGRKTVKH